MNAAMQEGDKEFVNLVAISEASLEQLAEHVGIGLVVISTRNCSTARLNN
jgi:hypothetical protein